MEKVNRLKKKRQSYDHDVKSRSKIPLRVSLCNSQSLVHLDMKYMRISTFVYLLKEISG